MQVIGLSMLTPRAFTKKRENMVHINKNSVDSDSYVNFWKVMRRIHETMSTTSIYRNRVLSKQSFPKSFVLRTLARLKQLKSWELVIEILEWLRCQLCWDFTERDYLMLITAYGKLGDFRRAAVTLQCMLKQGYLLNVVSYTSLMEAYSRGGQMSKAETVFRKMQSSGPRPSVLTYQIVLMMFVKHDRFKDAEDLFKVLLEEAFPFKPDQKMFHTMIYMYRKAGKFDRAYQLVEQMEELHIPQSTVTYNSLMSFGKDYKEVLCAYNQMQDAGLFPDVVSYTLLISAYAKARKEEEALAVFEGMLDAGVRPTLKAYNVLLDMFAQSGLVSKAQKVLKCMIQDRCIPDLCTYTTMLSAYVNASDMEGAEKFLDKLTEYGFEGDVVTYGTLLKGYAKANDISKLLEVYAKMREKGIQANQAIFTTIMDACGRIKNFDDALAWYKKMEACGVVPDKKARNVLLYLAKSSAEQQMANELVGHVVNPNNDTSMGNTNTIIMERK